MVHETHGKYRMAMVCGDLQVYHKILISFTETNYIFGWGYGSFYLN